MSRPIFDSKSEQKIYTRLKTYWSRYLDVFPQIPVRNVIGYDKLQEMDESQRVKDYLLTILMRIIGVNTSDYIWLFNTIGEYCLCRKTEKILGSDAEKWNLAIQNTEMTPD